LILKYILLTIRKTLSYLPKVIILILFFIALFDWNSFLNLKENLQNMPPEQVQKLLKLVLYLTTFIAVCDVLIFERSNKE